MKLLSTGFKDLDRKLHWLPGKVRNQLVRRSMRRAAKAVLDKAKTLVPEDTGTLRKSLKVRAGKPKGDVASARVLADRKNFDDFGGEDGYYAVWVEYGTATTPPNPFLNPAAQETRAQVEAILRQEIKEALGL